MRRALVIIGRQPPVQLMVTRISVGSELSGHSVLMTVFTSKNEQPPLAQACIWQASSDVLEVNVQLQRTCPEGQVSGPENS